MVGGQHGIMLESFWDDLGVIMGSVLGHHGAILGSPRGHMSVTLGPSSEPDPAILETWPESPPTPPGQVPNSRDVQTEKPDLIEIGSFQTGPILNQFTKKNGARKSGKFQPNETGLGPVDSKFHANSDSDRKSLDHPHPDRKFQIPKPQTRNKHNNPKQQKKHTHKLRPCLRNPGNRPGSQTPLLLHADLNDRLDGAPDAS